MLPRLALPSVAVALLISGSSGNTEHRAATDASPAISPNDNRSPAGQLKAGVLTISLEARQGTWRPDGAEGPSLVTAAFAEKGRPLQTPGPLIRVPTGTEIHASVRNLLAKPMWLYGMGERRGLGDSVQIAAGATRDVHFRVSEPGAFYYAARTTDGPIAGRLNEDSQLGGVIIVDPPKTKPDPHERIFAISLWATIDPKTPSGLGPNTTLAFNGLAWPATERLSFTQGDTVRFRFVNLSPLVHPLHLHGFYFTVDAMGDSQKDTLYSADQRRTGVTEIIEGLKTMSLSWVASRPGNWIFHCHFASHMALRSAFDADRSDMTPRMMTHDSLGAMRAHMAGLVLGMTVKPRGEVMQAGAPMHPIRLLVRSKSKVYGDNLGFSFVLGGSPEEANRDAMPVPGPMLELTKGERVAVTIVNKSHDEAAVHWHGIELESYPDGVPGFSGAGKNVLPMIEPGDSLTVRFTPPRAGTFMYHSHSNEMQQISSGLYGAIVVNEPGVKRDTTHDKVLLVSDAGPEINFFDPARYPPSLLNGQRTPAPIDVAVGEPVRLRLINIRTEHDMDFELLDGGKPAQWRILAKDGMPRPANQSEPRLAKLRTAPGEIYDLEITPRAGSSLVLKYDIHDMAPQFAKPVTLEIRAH
jgi:manganese oxidase